MNHPESPLAMDPEAMRRLGYEAVDALVDRWAGLRDTAPWQGASRAEMEMRYPVGAPAPEQGRPPEDVLNEALHGILAHAARVDHPRFLAYIPTAPTWPSVVGDFLASGFNIFQGSWQSSAGPSQIELQVLDWFARWLSMPEGTSGVFTSGGSAANAIALVVARARASAAGAQAGRFAVYLSDQGHSSLLRAARISGIPDEGIRILPSDDGLRLRGEVVRAALAADRAEGWTPIFLAANGGATNTGIVDPLDELADVATAEGVHFHVDGAYGGFGILDPRGAEALRGIGRADSVTLDPHKWLFQPYECGCLIVRDPAWLTSTFEVTPDYLRDTRLGADEVNFADRGVQLTRRFRALKVWMSITTFGLSAIRSAVSHGFDLAVRSEARLRSSDVLEPVVPAALGITVWRVRSEWLGHPPGGQQDRETLHRKIQTVLSDEGLALISSTRLKGDDALRFAFVNPATRWEDVEAIVSRAEAIVRALANFTPSVEAVSHDPVS